MFEKVIVIVNVWALFEYVPFGLIFYQPQASHVYPTSPT